MKKKTIFLTALALALFCSAISFISGSEARPASSHIAAGSFAQAQVVLSINDMTVIEGVNSTAVFTVTLNFLNGPPGGFRDFTTRVDFATSDGAAAAPGDYTQSGGTLIFPAGPSPATRTISIPIVDDSVAEPPENFTVILSNPSNGGAPFLISISRANGVCSILDNDAPPPILPALSINDVTVLEGAAGTTNAVFTVSLSAAPTSTVTVDFSTADGTATVADNDYISASGTLTFPPGSTTPMTISVAVVGDTRDEASFETFFVNLSNPSLATIADGQGFCEIIQTRSLPRLSIESETRVVEGDAGTTTNAVFTVRLSETSASTVKVDFSTENNTATVADNDYIGASGTLTFPPGSITPMTISVAVVGDTRVEENESFLVRLSNPSGAVISPQEEVGVGTILNDEPGTDCAFRVEPASGIHPDFEIGSSFKVISPPGCLWEAKSEVDWITIIDPIGAGELGVDFLLSANENPFNGSSTRREGIINVFPRGSSTPAAAFTAIQEGLACTFSVSPSEAVARADGQGLTFSVTAPNRCRWNAQSRSDFISISEIPLDPRGDGTVKFRVVENTASFRSAIVRVAGKDVSIYQNTPDCPQEFFCRILPIACPSPAAQSGSDMLGTSRQFRDKVLARSAGGQRYARLYYDFSGEIVRQMIFRPSLVLRSLEIKERYLPVIEAMVRGAEVTLTTGDIEEIDSFLKTIAERGSRELQETIKGIRADLRDPQVHSEFRVKVIPGPKRERNAPLSPSRTPPRTLAMSDREARLREAFAKLPMRFELNQGQTGSQVKFIARGPGYGLFLTPNEATLRLRNADVGQFGKLSHIRNPQSDVLRLRLAGANLAPKITGLDELPGKSNYFRGRDRSGWRANVPSFARVKYENVYKGVDLVYYGNQGQLEYDFIVAPGADPSAIRLAFDGAEKIDIDANGDLTLHAPGGALRQRKPLVYQEVNGARHEIHGKYAIRNPQSAIRNQVAIEVGEYDATKPLIIDPVLVYSTFLGGSGIDEGSSIAVDDDGQVYVAGFTESLDFPLAHAAQPVAAGEQDAFVAKLSADGERLIYATYLGGSGQDNAVSIAADSHGNAYVTGFTASPNFPTLHALQPALRGPSNSFVTKLNERGSLVYSTYLGGSQLDFGSSVAVDAWGNVYVVGITASPDFPLVDALQPAFGGVSDAYLAKLDRSGRRLLFSTYLGGSSTDGATGVAVDWAGNVYVAGVTNSADFRTAGPLQSSYGGSLSDGFVAKLNPRCSELIYATYLGGSRVDRIFRLAVDREGAAYVTGDTDSPDFPTVNAHQPAIGGGTDAFVAKINPSGSALVYSTYLGGDNVDGGAAIAVERSGATVVTGYTSSANFPTLMPVREVNSGGESDAFVTRLDRHGRLAFSTYLGGGGRDTGFGVAVDSKGKAYVMGLTDSTDFPVENPLQGAKGGAEDIFIAKLNTVASNPVITDAELLRNGKLLVIGSGFEIGAQVLLNGEPQRTRNFHFKPRSRLVAKVHKNDVEPGETVTLQVRNPDGTISPEFSFTWPVRREGH